MSASNNVVKGPKMVHNQGSNNTAALKGMSPSRSSRTDSPNSCKRVCQQDHVEELKIHLLFCALPLQAEGGRELNTVMPYFPKS